MEVEVPGAAWGVGVGAPPLGLGNKGVGEGIEEGEGRDCVGCPDTVTAVTTLGSALAEEPSVSVTRGVGVRSEEGEVEVVPVAAARDAVAVARPVGRGDWVGEGEVLAVVLPPPPPPPTPPPADTREECVGVALPEVLPLEVELPPTLLPPHSPPPTPPPPEVSVGVEEGQEVEEGL